jgi:ribosomal protein L37AE/L43A
MPECPFCRSKDVVISGDYEWHCRACKQTYPTQAFKCQVEDCWGYAEGTYCDEHESASNKP